MPEQLVDVVQVHVVMVHLVVALGITTDIAIGVHLCAPAFLGSCQIHLRILRGMMDGRFNTRHLTFGIGIEMTALTVVPPQHIAHIGSTPASQRHAPTDAAMKPRRSVPVAISSKNQRTTQCIDIRIGGTELDTARHLAKKRLGLLIGLTTRLGIDNGDLIHIDLEIGSHPSAESSLYGLQRFACGFQTTWLFDSDIAITV